MPIEDIASTAVQYVQHGWKVIQLHDVVAGHCSCHDGPTCESAGKHPVARKWQMTFLATPEQVRAAWLVRPTANIGVVTGPASGLWVLDVDPEHGGNQRLTELESQFGMLPTGYTVTTGSGGLHFYFDLAGVGFDLSNSRGRLPLGLDVRGRGGFVVAPPSVSGKGPYSLLREERVAPAVGWLLEQVRPAARAVADPEQVRQMMAGAAPRDGHAYVRAAVGALLGELAGAPPGMRNETAFRVACRLVEFGRAAWSGVELEQLCGGYMAACGAANVDGRFLDGEAWSVWLKAVARVKDAAVLPPADFLGELVRWEDMPRPTADFGGAGQGSAIQFLDPASGLSGPLSGAVPGVSAGQGVVPSLSPAVPALSPWDLAIQAEMYKMGVRDEARRRLELARTPAVDWAAEILDEDQMANIPRPAALVQGWLFSDSLARVIGRSGSMKSFAAVDLAVCVSAGLPWHGHPVRQVDVLYVVAEGASDVDIRLRAARDRYGLNRHGVRIILRPVQLGGPQWDSFVAHLVGLAESPGLVIFDTQARVTEQRNENDASEMGEAIGAAEQLRAATGACVLLVHHTGLGADDRGRGTGAVFAALTTELLVMRNGMNMTITGKKQKTIETGTTLLLTAQKAVVVDKDPLGILTEWETLVLVAAADPDAAGRGVEAIPTNTRDVAIQRVRALVVTLRDNFGSGNGGTRAEIRAIYLAHPTICDLPPDAQKKSWQRAWGRLEELGRIARNPIAERFMFVDIDGLDDLERNPGSLVEFGWPTAERHETDGDRSGTGPGTGP